MLNKASTARDFYVGRDGVGNFFFGNAFGTGSIAETGVSSRGINLTVRATTAASGTFQGWGVVGLTGTLNNNGRIIADGYETERTLDLSLFGSVGHTIINATNNGWFVQNHGKLLLPNVPVITGSKSYTWGQAASDATPDLVNAMHIAFSNVLSSGSVSIALLAVDRTDVPSLGNFQMLDIWQITPTGGLAFDSANLTIRYDDALAAS